MSENLTIAYLVTNQDDISFPDYKWGNNIIHTQENLNYIFAPYKDLNIAKFIQPCLEQQKTPNFWKVQIKEIVYQDSFRIKSKFCESVEKCDNTEPTDEQRMNFAIMLSLNYIKNQVFKKWALQYLKNENRTQELAKQTVDEISEYMKNEVPDNEMYISSIHAILEAVISGNYRLYCAASAHRLIWDAPESLNAPIFASSALKMDTNQVISLLESSL